GHGAANGGEGWRLHPEPRSILAGGQGRMTKMRSQIRCGHEGRKVVGHGLCAACYTRWNRARRGEVERRQRKDYNLRKCYGITVETFATMLEAQRGCCALCLKRFPDSTKAHVDH